MVLRGLFFFCQSSGKGVVPMETLLWESLEKENTLFAPINQSINIYSRITIDTLPLNLMRICEKIYPLL